MGRFDPALCQCSFGLLCGTSGGALMVCGLMFLMVG